MTQIPTLLGEAVQGALDGRDHFPFRSWAARAHFVYPAWSTAIFAKVGSAAEAYLLRGFVDRPGARATEDGVAVEWQGTRVEPQRRCRMYRLDFAVERAGVRLDVEIDGMGFHHRTREQVAADYLRDRRVTLSGYAVVRFTAQETFQDPAECWRQIELMLAAMAGRVAE